MKKQTEETTGIGNGLRYNNGKLRYDLVEPRAHRDMVEVLTDGAIKYSDRNWENGMSWTSVIASLKRHLIAIESSEDYDKESGRLHVAHLACNAHFLNAYYYLFPQGDDRCKTYLNTPKIGLDIDCVLADFTKGWAELYEDVPSRPNHWGYDLNMGKRFKEMKDSGELDSFYLSLEPCVHYTDIPFEPHCYITARPVSVDISKQWLLNNGFSVNDVFSVDLHHSKVDVAKESGIDIFVDDSYDNFVELNNAGIFTYLYTAPHNVKYDVGHMRVNSLKTIPCQR